MPSIGNTRLSQSKNIKTEIRKKGKSKVVRERNIEVKTKKYKK